MIVFDALKEEEVKECQEEGITLTDFKHILEAGSSQDTEAKLEEAEADDVYVFSYTSGTTGDSKGVKLSHRNIMSSVSGVSRFVPLAKEDRIISYLPYPHSFEQCLFGLACMKGCKIGFYQGDPLKLVDDCAVL